MWTGNYVAYIRLLGDGAAKHCPSRGRWPLRIGFTIQVLEETSHVPQSSWLSGFSLLVSHSIFWACNYNFNCLPEDDLTDFEFIFRPLTATSARCCCWLMGWCVILVGSVSTMNALKRQTRNSNVNQCQPTQSLWSIIGLKVNINKLFISLFKQLKFCSHDRKLAPRVSLPCLWNWVWNRTVFVWF